VAEITLYQIDWDEAMDATKIKESLFGVIA